MSKNSQQKDEKYELWEWILFTISALFFTVSSIRTGNVVGLLGGVFFLIACIVLSRFTVAVITVEPVNGSRNARRGRERTPGTMVATVDEPAPDDP